MKLPVAVQLYSVRDEMQDDFYGTIKKMKEYGYDGVEFAGLFGEEPAKIREFCNEIGIVPISAHVPYYDMLADPEKVAAMKTARIIGRITKPELGSYLESRDGNELPIRAQGWTAF